MVDLSIAMFVYKRVIGIGYPPVIKHKMDHNRSFSYETFHSVRGFSTAMFDYQRVDKILDDPTY